MKFHLIIILISITLLYSNDVSYIDNIIITGNNNIPKHELYKNMRLKKPSLFMRNEFSNKIFKQDIQNIIGYYKTHGYLEVTVKSKINKQKNKYIEIIYTINEGEQYLFHKLDISGNKFLSNNKIFSFFEEGIGKNYDSNLIMNQLIKLKREYLKNGRLGIIIKEEIIPKGNIINLRINISEGDKYKIQDININGLKTISKKYIERELTFNNGDIFNINNIDQSRKRIFDSGLFSSVEIIPDIQENYPGYVDLNINVREYKLSSIEADFGFSELSAWQNNLLTPGLDAHAKWTLGNVMNSASNIIISCGIASEINFQSIENKSNLIQLDSKFIYTSPWTFNLRFPTILELFYDVENDQDISINRSGTSYLAYWEKTKTSRYEILATYEIINSDSMNIIEINEPIRSVEFNYINNKVKNIFSPSGGTYLQFKTTLFGNILGGNRNFIKINYEYRKYMPIFKRGIIAIRLKFGYIENLDELSSLPSYYLFELGGQTSLRGWPLPSTFSEPKNKFELFNLEYRFPIYKEWGGEIFYDAGSLVNSNEFSEYDLQWNYGIGITYNTTIGPIRIEYAIPGNNNNEIDETFHASILYMF